MRGIFTFLQSAKHLVAAIILMFGSIGAVAQFDTEFWMPPIWDVSNIDRNSPSNLFITTPFDFPVNVQVTTSDGTTFVFNGTVTSGSPLSVPLTPVLGQTNIEGVPSTNQGLHITSSAPIQCTHKVAGGTNQTLVILKGKNALGQEFYCGSQVRNLNSNYGPEEYHFISVMAMENNTQVTFQTPFTMYGSAGALANPHAVTLQAGQSYLIRGNSPTQHVAGARVTSNKDIVVNSGSTHTRISGTGANAADGGTDQLVPIGLAGTEWVIIKGNNNFPWDYAIVVATQNNTNVYIDGSATPVATINAGQFFDWTTTGTFGAPHYIRTDRRAYVYHVSGCSQDEEVDMSAMPEISCTGSRYIEFSRFNQPGLLENLQVLIPPTAESTLKLNGIDYDLIPGVVIQNVPGLTGWRAATYPNASLPTNNILTSQGFFHAGWLTGNGSTGAFGYLSGFDDAFEFQDPFAADPIPTTIYNVATLCQGQSVDHCLKVYSCGANNFIDSFTGNEGNVVIAPPSSPSDTCFRYTAPFNFVGRDTVTFVVSNEFGFEGSIDLIFTVVNPDTPINAGPDQFTCGASSATLSAINPDPLAVGYWTVSVGSGVLVNPNSPTTVVNNLSAGVNAFIWHQDYPSCGVNKVDLVQITRFSGTPPAAAAGPDANLCSSTTYIMQANNPSVAAIGTWSITSGSATIANINLANTLITNLAIGVNTFSWSISNGPCPGGDTTDEIVIRVFNQNHPAANAGPDQSICGTSSGGAGITASLTANAAQVPAVGSWSVIAGTGTFANANSQNTVVSGLSIGTNTFRWTINNGPCGTLTDEVTIIVFSPTSPNATAGPDQTVCLPTNSTNLAGNTPTAPAVGTWTVIAGSGAFANANLPTTSVSGLSLGTNTFRWTVNNGPCPGAVTFDEITIVVFPVSQPTVNAGPDQSFCFTSTPISATLAGSAITAPGTGLWTVVSGTATFANASNPNTTVTGLSLGNNVLQWTASNGTCDPSVNDQMIITVFNGNISTAFAGPDGAICAPATTYTMSATAAVAPSTGLWTQTSGPSGAAISNTSSPTTQITNLTSGVYVFRWTIQNGPCGNTVFDEMTLNVFNASSQTANAGPDQSLCFTGIVGVSATMAANTVTAPSTGTWTLVTGGGTIVTPNSPTTTISNLPVGINIFRWTVNNGVCGSSNDLVAIFVFSSSQASANAGPDQTICSSTTTVNMAGNNVTSPATGVWTQVNGPSTLTFASASSANTSVTGMVAGVYTLQWTINNGPCSSPSIVSDQMTLTVFPAAQTAANAGPDQSICNTTTSINLNSNTPIFPATGQWSIVSGSGTFTNSTSPVTSVTGLGVGVNCFRWTINNGPCGSPTIDEVCITVFDVNAPAANAGTDQSFCLPQTSTTLNANNATFPATGAWTVIAGTGTFSNASSSSSSVSGLSLGTNTFRWTINNGSCGTITFDEVTITIFNSALAPPNAGPDANLCTPTSTYVMQGSTVAAPATGVWTLIAGTGTIANPNSPTTSISGLGIGANIFRWTILNGPCPAGQDFDEMTIFVYDENQQNANAGPDQSLCFTGIVGVSATMAASPVIFPGSGLWTVIQGSGTFANASNPNTQILNIGVGQNIFRWTVNNGPCANATTFDDVTVLVYSGAQAAANAGPDQSLCSTNPSTTLAANNVTFPGTGQWTVVQGTATFANASSPTTTVSGLSTGTNVLQWTINNGPCAPSTTTDQVTILVYNNAQAPANAGPDFTACTSQGSITLTGTTFTFPATGTWALVSGSATITNPNQATTTATALGVGTNIFSYTINNGPCAAPTVDQVTVIVYSASQAASNAGPDQSICLPTNSVSLSANSLISPATGVWTLISGSGTITSPNTPNTTVTALGIGENIFRWTISNGPCSPTQTVDQVSIIVFNNALAAANAGPDQSFCEPVSSATLVGNTATFPASGQWTWVSGPTTPVITAPSSATTQVTGLGVGANVFRWTITNGPCAPASTNDEVTIFIFDADQPAANAGPDQFLCSPASTTQLAGNNALFPATGTWTLIQGTGTIANANSPTSNISGLSIGENIFRWTVSNGPCSNSTTFDQVSIFVYDSNAPAANAGPDQSKCTPTSSIVMAANAAVFPGAGTWTLISGSGIIVNANSPTTTINNLAVGQNIFRWTINNGACGSQTTFDEVSIFVFSNSSPSANAGPDQNICTPITSTTLAGSVPVFPSTGVWTWVSGPSAPVISNPSNPATAVSALTVGVHVFQWTVNNGPCAAGITTDQMTINVFDGNAPLASAGADQEICLPTTTTNMTATPATFPGSGVWTLIQGSGTITSPTSATTSITGLTVGENIFRWTVSNGNCTPSSSFDQVSIFIFDNTQAAANAGADQSFCEPTSSTTLVGNNITFPATGQWTWVSGPTTPTIVSANNPSTAVTGLGVGANVFRWTIDNGPCAPSTTQDEITILIFDIDQPDANAGPDQSLCSPTFNTLLSGNVATFPSSGQWTLISGTGTIVNPTSPTTAVTGLSIGENIFRWTVSNGPCANATTFDQVSIFVFDSAAPSATAGPDQSICTPTGSVVMAANAAVFPGTGVWTLVSGSGLIVNPTSPTTTINNLAVGQNIFRWTINNGACGSQTTFDEVSIFVFSEFSPIANAGEDQDLCTPITSTNLQGSVPIFPSSGFWTFISGPSTPTIVDPTNPNTLVTGLAIGPNVFQWTVTNGPCASGVTTDQVTITLFNGGAATPNAGPDQEICSPLSSVQLGADAAVFPGIGEWTLINGTGTFVDINDESTIVNGLTIGVNTFRWSVNYSTCGSPFDEVDIIVYDSSQGAAVAGPDQQICTPDNSINMAADAVLSPGFGTWSLVSGSGAIQNINDPNTLITNLPVGENIFVWTVYNGSCLAPALTTDTVSIFVFSTDNLDASAGLDQSFCTPTNSALLTGSALIFPSTGIWTIEQGTGNIADPTSPFTTITDLTVGETILRWTVNNGPCPNTISTDEMSIFIFDETQSAANAGADQELCSTNPSTTLAGNNVIFPATGLWTIVQGTAIFADATNPTTSVSGLSIGTNILQWTIENGPCDPSSTTDQVTIIVFDNAQAPANAGLDIDACTSQGGVTVNGTAFTFPATGAWALVSGSGTITTPNSATTTITNLGVGTNVFSYTINNGPCAAPSVDFINVDTFDEFQPEANAGDDQILCSPISTTTVTGSAVTYPAVGTWTLVQGTGTIVSPNSPTTTINGLSIGVNVFRWTISNGPCDPTETFDELTITVYNSAQGPAQAGNDQEICTPSNSVNMTADAVLAPGFGTWSIIAGSGVFTDINDPNTLVTNLPVGENIFVWTVYNGTCLAPELTTDTVTIFVYETDNLDADAGVDQSFCTPVSSATLTGSALIQPSTGLWTILQGTGVISNPTSPTTTITGLTVGETVVRWTVNNGPCPNTITEDELSIFLFDENQADANAGPDQELCTPTTSTTLQGNAVTFPAIGTWTVLSGTGIFADANDPNTTVTGLSVGQNSFHWTINNGPCANGITTDAVNIFVFDENNPIANAGADQEVCLPTTTVTLQGSSYTFPANGVWTFLQGSGTITNINDPGTTVTDLAVGTNILVWSVSNGPCAPSITTDQVEIRVYDVDAPLANAGADQELCEPNTTTNMAALVPTTPGFGTWSVLSGAPSVTIADVNDPFTEVTGLAVGQTILLWTVYNGPCDNNGSFDVVSIFVFESSQPAANAGPDQDICTPQTTANLVANNVIFPATGTWTLQSGSGTIVNPTSPVTIVENLGVGANVFCWTISNGPCDPPTTTDCVTINVFDSGQSAANAGPDQEFCLPTTSSVLVGSAIVGSAVGQWSIVQGGGFISNISSAITNISNLPQGENIFRWTVDNGSCGTTQDEVSVFIYNNDAPEADAGEDVSFCTPTSTYTMTANTPEIPGLGTWSIVSGPGFTGTGTIDDINNPTANISGLVIGENRFSWTIYNGPCEVPTTDLISIFIYDENQPVADAGEDQEICLPQTAVDLDANDPIFPSAGQWTILQGSGTITDINDPNTSVTDLAQGNNILQWTTNNGPCDPSITSDVVTISVFDPNAPEADAGPDQSFCEPVSSTNMAALLPSIPGVGTWTLVGGTGTIADINDPNTLITDLVVGENCFLWTVYNGPCEEPTEDVVCIYIYPSDQSIADAGEDQELCTPLTETQLTANAVEFPALGVWTLISGSGTINDIYDPNTIVTDLGDGVNQFLWAIDNGACDNPISSDIVEVRVYSEDQTDANAGLDQEFCLPTNSTTVNGIELIAAATGTWTLIDGGGTIVNPTSSTTDIVDLPIGNNIFVWEVYNGPCGVTTDTITISIFNPSEVIALAGDDASYCTPDDTHCMSASVPSEPAIGTWILITGIGNIEDPNDPNTCITGLGVGENIFMWCIDNGPCGSTCDIMSIFVYNQATPDANAGPDIEICLPTNAVAMAASSAEFPAIGQWSLLSGSGTITDLNSPNGIMADLGLGTNVFVWTVNNGVCPNGITSDTVEVRVFDPSAELPNAGPDQFICTPQNTVTMAANAAQDPSFGFWNLIQGSATIADINDPLTEVSDLGVGINILTWSFYNSNCSEFPPTDTVRVLVYDEGQPPADAGPDQEFCFPTNSATMAANEAIVPAIGTWTLVSGTASFSDINDPNASITNLSPGTNVFVWTIDNGPCANAITTDTVEMRVFVPDAPVADAGLDLELCTPIDCIELSALNPIDPQVGTWSYVSSVNGAGNIPFGSIDDLNNPQANICALAVGVHTLQWNIYNGPCNNDSNDQLVISVYDNTAPAANAGEDIFLCAPENATLLQANAAIFPAVGTWSIASAIGPNGPLTTGTFGDLNDPLTSFTGLEIGIYTLIWTIDNGPCGPPTTDTVIIQVNNPASPNADAGPDQEFCLNFADATMAANTPLFPAIGSWEAISFDPTGTIVDTSNPSTLISDIPLNEHLFVWCIDNGSCANTVTCDTVSIYVNDITIAAANAGEDLFFCGAPDSLIMQASIAVGLAEGVWTFDDNIYDFTDSTFHESIVYGFQNGLNTFTWTVDNGACGISSDEIVITVFDPTHPPAEAGLSLEICENKFEPFNLNAEPPTFPATGWWTVVDGPAILQDSTNYDAEVLSLGEILVELEDVPSTLVWTIDNGVCGITQDSLVLILEDCLTVEVPDAFSPNGDGVNDTFVIPNLESYPNHSLKIFNRWGAQVFEAAPYMSDWDGKSKHPATIGEDLPVSTYYYILDLGTGEEAFHGFVYLKR